VPYETPAISNISGKPNELLSLSQTYDVPVSVPRMQSCIVGVTNTVFQHSKTVLQHSTHAKFLAELVYTLELRKRMMNSFLSSC
jgi:hypothetical protein